MCRIAGIVNRSLNQPAIEALVTQMCDLQKHGGPDSAGIYSCAESNLVLGHRRLALIDLTPSGHQPMVYSERYVISFNGEIYNFHELKTELKQAGKVFHTQCDTEVILAAFAQWNTQSFERLKGMFAFALYDTLEKNLFLVRDPSGIKPLYYATNNTSIEFASEIRAFSALKNKKEDKNWPVYQLAYGHIPEPVTTLDDVKPLHKGFFYRFNLSTGGSSLQSFTHYSFSNTIHGEKELHDTIKDTLHRAVGRHLLSDAPVGVFLSGGIDSGIIATQAFQYQQEYLKTLSIYFKEEEFSEKKYQDSIIDSLRCKNFQHLLSENEFQLSFREILQAMDMPSCDGLNTWFIAKYAKEQGFKAVLSGIGGDELFGGYPSFERISVVDRLRKLPASLLRFGRNSELKKINRLPYLSLEGFSGVYLFLRGQFIPLEIAKVLGATEKEIWEVLQEPTELTPMATLSPKNTASWLELNMYMQNQLLRDADVMGMAHGVEIRVPFLDDDVVRSLLAADTRIKYRGPLPKQSLINAFKDSLPQAVWNRTKMGFSFPFTAWLAGSAFVKEIMANNNAAARLNFEKFNAGKLHWSLLMSLIILQARGIS